MRRLNILLVWLAGTLALAAADPVVTFGNPPPADITDKQTSEPFEQITISDTDAGENVTVQISFAAGRGTFSTGGGLSNPSPGVYLLSARSPGNAQTFLRALDFNPVENRIPIGASETTTFTVEATDETNHTAQASVNLDVSPANDPPSVSLGSNPPDITDKQTSTPFAQATITDVDAGDTVTVRITFPANRGTFPTGGGLSNPSPGTYDLSARTPVSAQSFLRAMVFTPTENRIPIGGNEDTTFTATVTDGAVASDQDTLTLNVRPVNDPPALTGLILTPIDDNRAAALFAAVGITDIDNGGNQSVTATVSMDQGEGALGTFRNYPLPFSISGPVSQVTTELRAVLFDPFPNQRPVGSSDSFGLTVTVADSGNASAATTTNIVVRSVNDPPAVTATVNPSVVDDNRDVVPFQIQIADQDFNETFTVIIEPINDTNYFGNLNPTGPFTGFAAVVQAQVQSVRYTPVENRVVDNQAVQFRFRVTDSLGGAGSATNSLAIRAINDPPDIAGINLDLIRITDDQIALPFSTVQVLDVDEAGQQRVTVIAAVTDSTYGSFALTGVGTNATLAISNLTPAQASARLHQLEFRPLADRIPVGQTRTVALSIRVVDRFGMERSDNQTSVAITGVNGAPRIHTVRDPLEQPFLVSPTAPVKPFRAMGVAIEDDDTNVTVTISLDDPAKGILVGAFVEESTGSGIYRFTGDPASATTAITNLEFQVSSTYLFPPDAPGGTAFIISAEDLAPNVTVKTLAIVLQEAPRNWLVTRLEDDLEPGSLRYAITRIDEYRENNAVITFAVPPYPATIRLAQPLLLRRNLIVKGPGADSLTLSGDTDGNGQPDTQIFRVMAAVAIEGLALTEGAGGAAEDGALTGGAIYVGQTGRLLLRSCSITDSSAAQWGGGIDVNQGSLTMADCFVSGNMTDPAAGLGGGGISLYTARPCSFVNCTFSGNSQQSPSGFGGGAIYAENFSPIGELPIHILHCTFAGNDDVSDAGSSIHANVFGTFVSARNSIFADGLGRNLEVAGAARIVSQGGNISDDPATTTLTQGGQPELITFLDHAGDLRDTNPLLSGAALALQAGSPAIGLAVDPLDPVPNPVADRIGVIRESDPDAGALEFDSFARLIINEIHFDPDPQNTNDSDFVEFYVQRDSVRIDLGGYSLWIDGHQRHVFSNAVIQPGFGIIVADTAFSAVGTPVVLPSEGVPLNLTDRSLVELRHSDGRILLGTFYIGVFADTTSTNSTLNLDFARQSLTLFPQFRGFALVPNAISPGADTDNTPFGSPNAFPIAVEDTLIVNEDDLTSVPVLANDLDADRLDYLVIVSASTTSSYGAPVAIDPTRTTLLYDPRQTENLQNLPEGAKRTDQLSYSVVDFGASAILDYSGSNGLSPVTVVSHGHRLTNSDVIIIAGAGVPAYNGQHVVTRIDADSFSIPLSFAGSHDLKGSWVTRDPRHPTQTNQATVILTVLGANDPPAVLPDTAATDEETVIRLMATPDLAGTATNFDTDGQYPARPLISTVSLLSNDDDIDSDDDRNTIHIVGLDAINNLAATSELGATIKLELRANRIETSLVYNPRSSPYLNGLALGEVAIDTFSYTVQDRHGAVTVGQVTIQVTGVNDLPNPGPDPDPVVTIFTTGEDTPLTIAAAAVLANDSDIDRTDALAVAAVSPLSNAGAQVQLLAGSIIYNPTTSSNLNALAREEPLLDTFQITVSDNNGGVATSVVSVLVIGANDTPIAMEDRPETFEEAVLTFNPQLFPPAPDSDADINGVAPDNRLRIIPAAEIITPIGARVNITTNSATYDPTPSTFLESLGPGESFEDSFQYTIMDGSFVFANDDLFKTQPDGAGFILDVLVNDRDFTGSTGGLRVISVTPPNQRGDVSIGASGMTLIYTPEVNFVGDETFDYMVSNPEGDTDKATVTVRVTVTEINGNLRANPDAFTIAAGQRPNLDVLANDGPGLTITRILGSPPGPAQDRVILTNNQITYIQTAPGPFPYQQTFLYEISGGGTARDIAAVLVTVVNRQDTLDIRDDAFAVETGTTDNPLDVLANDSILPGSAAGLTVLEITQTPENGTVQTNAQGTLLLYTPDPGYVGEDTFAYVATDGFGGTGSGLVRISVGSLTTNPDFFVVPFDDPNTNVDDATIDLDVLANDLVLQSGGATITLIAVTPPNPSLGAMTIKPDGSTLVFDPAPDQEGEQEFVYTVRDGSTRTATGRATVVVVREGVKANSDAFAVAVDSSANVLNVLANDAAIPNVGRRLTISQVTAPNHGGAVLINPSGEQLIYTPAPGFSGEEIFNYTMTDSRQTDTAKVIINVTSGALTANPDAFTVFFVAPPPAFTLPVLANDRVLPDLGQTLTITGVGINHGSATNAPDQEGQVQIGPDGATLLYRPNDLDGPFPYVETFTYEISDVGSPLGPRRAQAVVTVEVQQRANIRQLETNPDAFIVAAGSQNNLLDVFANDNVKPANAAGWIITSITPPAFNGIASISGGAIRYTPAPGFVGADHFIYSVSDGFGGTGSAFVTVRVGDRPLSEDHFTAISGTLLNEFDVLANDAIRPATATGFELFDAFGADRNGIVSVLNGKVLYSPNPGHAGAYPYLENFFYLVRDDSLGVVTGRVAVAVFQAGSDRATATVRVTVHGENDPSIIAGTVAGQRVYERSAIRPFSGVTISDIDSQGAQPLVVRVIIDQPTQGNVIPSGGFVSIGGDVYALGDTNAGVTPAAATAALRGLVFSPTPGTRVTPEAPETTRLTIIVSDNFAEVSDDLTTVIAIDPSMTKRMAPDAQPGDQFGFVAASRDLVVVGAPFGTVGSIRPGVVYIYARADASFTSWPFIQKLTPTSNPSFDLFGNAVAISGTTIVVGAPADVEGGRQSGSVYVFEDSSGQGVGPWVLSRKIVPADSLADDQFGFSVAIDGDTLVVGARFDDDRGQDSGSAYVFGRHRGGQNNWGLARKLNASTGLAGDLFGHAVAVSDDTVAVAARRDDDAGADSGAAFLFLRDLGGIDNWGQLRRILPADGAANDDFGSSISLDAGILVVGARFDDDRGADSGSAYVFARDQGGSGQWGQLTKLLPADGTADDLFGASVSIDGNHILVGAPRKDQAAIDSGAAYLFRLNTSGQWTQIDKLLPDTNVPGAEFGLPVALKDHTAVAGARFDSERGSNAGAVHIYRLKFNNPPQLVRPIPDQVAHTNQPFNLTLPAGMFSDPDLDDALTLSSSSVGNSPAWLTFDPLAQAFSGVPTTPATYLIVVTATDADGDTADDTFTLLVPGPQAPLGPIIPPRLTIRDDPASGAIRVSFERLYADSAYNFSLEISGDLLTWSSVQALVISTDVTAGPLSEIITHSLNRAALSTGPWFFRLVSY